MHARLGVLVTWLLLGSWLPAQASGACDVRYFLPVRDGASWTYARDVRPRTIQNVAADGFEVHAAYPTE